MSSSTSSWGSPNNWATTIMGSRFATALIHSIRPPTTESDHNSCAVCVGELFDDADALGRQVWQQDPAVCRMHGIVGSRQRMHGVTRRAHVERCHGAVVVADHRRGQVRGEVLDAVDGLHDRIPAAHCVEVRLTDAMNRRLGAHALVERIGILYRLDAE